MLDVAPTYIGNAAYFDSLHKDCEDDAVQAAFLHLMLNIKLYDWRPGKIPDTRGLRAQRYHSFNSVQFWFADALHNGSFDTSTVGYDEPWPKEMKSSTLYSHYLKWCDANRKGEYGRVSQCMFSRYLAQMFKKLKRIDNTDNRGFYFGTLQMAISTFEEF